MNELRSFEKDLQESMDTDLIKDWIKTIPNLFGKAIQIKWMDDDISQKDYGCDGIVTTFRGKTANMRIAFDIKTRNEAYYEDPNYIFEILHHIYRDQSQDVHLFSKPGWLYNSNASIIFFGTKQENRIVEILAFDLGSFNNENFKGFFHTLNKGWAHTLFDSGRYQMTMNTIVHRDIIKHLANAYGYWNINGKDTKLLYK